MSYKKTTWINDSTPVNADNMNKIEEGIEAAHNDISTVRQDLSKLSGNTKASVEDLEKRIDSVEKVSAVSTAKVEAATDLAKAAAENVMQKDQCASVMDLITGQPMYFGRGSKEEVDESILAAPGESVYFEEDNVDYEALVKHPKNTENPHGVTYDQVGAAPASVIEDVDELKTGKAPAGYVDARYSIPGETENPEQMLEDIIQEVYSGMPNNTVKCISLNDNVGTTSVSGGHNFIVFYKTTSEYGCLKVVKYSQNRVITMERSLFGGVWGDWCEDNPNMYTGVEYRTTERWNGLPVYRKRVTYTFAEKIDAMSTYVDVSIPTGIYDGHQIVRCSAASSGGAVLPYFGVSGGVSAIIRIVHNGAILRIHSDTWDEGTAIYLELAYVKK